MSNGHTPGPWKIRRASNLQLPERNSVFCLEDEADGWNIGIVSTWVNDKEDAVEAEANARLIVAAPELYKHADALLTDVMQRYGITEDGLTCPHMRGLAEALRKARGT